MVIDVPRFVVVVHSSSVFGDALCCSAIDVVPVLVTLVHVGGGDSRILLHTTPPITHCAAPSSHTTITTLPTTTHATPTTHSAILFP